LRSIVNILSFASAAAIMNRFFKNGWGEHLEASCLKKMFASEPQAMRGIMQLAQQVYMLHKMK
jgi:hypothetical protein